jgi:hypothetical protein
MLSYKYTLENTEKAIKNGKFRETGNIGSVSAEKIISDAFSYSENV